MGKTVNCDEDLLPPDLVMARLVVESNVAKTECPHHSAEESCACWMLLQIFGWSDKMWKPFDGIHKI